MDPLQLSAEVSATTRTKWDTGYGRRMAQAATTGCPRSAVDAWVAPQKPTSAGRGGFPRKNPRTKRHYATHGGMAASMVSLALDKPLCR